MSNNTRSRRAFLRVAAAATGAGLLAAERSFGRQTTLTSRLLQAVSGQPESADYVLRIAASPIEIAPKHIVSTITYNGQFPGPLLRFKEGQPVTVEVHNDTDTPEQLHWHGQMVPADVDGAAEEGTPFHPAHGMRRIQFTPRPSGFRFYHTHNRAGADLHAGQYSGQVGPVYIEPRTSRAATIAKSFSCSRSSNRPSARAAIWPRIFLSPATRVKELADARRVRDEGLARERDAARLRSGLSLFHHQWSHVGPRRTDAREAGRARALSCSERQRDRDSQPGVAGALVSRWSR